MKRFYRLFVWGAVLLLAVLLLSGSRTALAGTSVQTLPCDEHPWDLLSQAVKIEILSVTENFVVLRVWLDLDEEPIIIQVDRTWFESRFNLSPRKRANRNQPASYLE